MKAAEKEGEIEKLCAKIGQVVVDFGPKASQRRRHRFEPNGAWMVNVSGRREMIEPGHRVLSIRPH